MTGLEQLLLFNLMHHLSINDPWNDPA